MRIIQIEAWTLQVADDIKHGRPVEDARVEIKSKWPEPNGAARRIAGHANAAHGEPILWIIGIDETKGEVLGADRTDLASWYPQVQAEFKELAPMVIDLNIPYDGKTLVALLFDTERAPFVVKNPMYGKQGGGPVSDEVPWREGTKVRSATRSDLIRMLTPLEGLPELQLLSMGLLANKRDDTTLSWRLDAQIYVSSKTRGEMIFPFHACSAIADIGGHRRRVNFGAIAIMPYPRPHPAAPSSPTIRFSSTEIIIASAGMVTFTASGSTPLTEFGNHIGDPAHCIIKLVQAHDSRPVILAESIQSDLTQRRSGQWGLWGAPIS